MARHGGNVAALEIGAPGWPQRSRLREGPLPPYLPPSGYGTDGSAKLATARAETLSQSLVLMA